MHHLADFAQRFIGDGESRQEGFEGAILAMMRKLSLRVIEWNSAGHGIGLAGKLKASLRIDEPANQPGAGNAVDFRPGTRHPGSALELRGLKARDYRHFFRTGRILEPIEL